LRKRQFRARVWLDEFEYGQFIENVARSGHSQETYLRKMITGYLIKESPPLEYYDLIQQLLVIGRNLNQIAAVANAIRSIDTPKYKENYVSLIRMLLEIQKAVEC
jgi:hypothetical protein